MSSGRGLTIREMAARTGVAPATLRMWEARYGFPLPACLPSAHRRYSDADAEDVLSVAHGTPGCRSARRSSRRDDLRQT